MCAMDGDGYGDDGADVGGGGGGGDKTSKPTPPAHHLTPSQEK